MASSTGSRNESVAYVNGRVYTIDQAKPWAEAFIVSPDGTFSHIGTSAEIDAIAAADALVTHDLQGAFVMPGIHDAHMHLLTGGLTQTSEAHIGFDSNAENIASRLKEASCACAYSRAYGDWILGATFINDFFPDGKPDRKFLDDLFPDTPIVLRGGGGHDILANTAALVRAGYDLQNEPDGKFTQFFRREDGSLTGEMAEMAMTKIALAIPKPPMTHVKRALRHAVAVAHAAGITSLQEASANTIELMALRDLDRDDQLKIDLFAHLVQAPEHLAFERKESLDKLREQQASYRTKHVRTNFAKFLLDGVPLPPLLSHCGLDEHGNVDESKIAFDGFAEMAKVCDDLGMTIKVHATGHGSTRRTMDVFEALRKANPNGPKHEVGHCSGVHPDEFTRFGPLNVTAEMSPAYFFAHPLTAASNGAMEWDFNRMLDAGARVTIGSDWPVDTDPSLLQPLAGIVEQVGSGSKEKGGEILCRLLTLSGAEAVSNEKESGSIEIGKKANFIALDHDLSKGEFDGAKVKKTWFEGEMVYEAVAPKL